MKEFQIQPYNAVGGLTFGIDRNQVRELLGSNYKEFKKSKFNKINTDDYKFAHIYYDENKNFNAIEYFNTEDTSLLLEGHNLMSMKFIDLQALFVKRDKKLVIGTDSLTSYKYGVAFYAPTFNENPSTKAESIIVFQKDYYG